jgi:hypothetical protein
MRAILPVVGSVLVVVGAAWFWRYTITPTTTPVMFLRYDRWTHGVELCHFEKTGGIECLSPSQSHANAEPKGETPAQTARRLKAEKQRLEDKVRSDIRAGRGIDTKAILNIVAIEQGIDPATLAN